MRSWPSIRGAGLLRPDQFHLPGGLFVHRGTRQGADLPAPPGGLAGEPHLRHCGGISALVGEVRKRIAHGDIWDSLCPTLYGFLGYVPTSQELRYFFWRGARVSILTPHGGQLQGGGDLPVDFPWNPVHLLGQLSPVFAYELHGQGLVGEAHVHDAGDP